MDKHFLDLSHATSWILFHEPLDRSDDIFTFKGDDNVVVYQITINTVGNVVFYPVMREPVNQ